MIRLKNLFFTFFQYDEIITLILKKWASQYVLSIYLDKWVISIWSNVSELVWNGLESSYHS